MNEKGMFVEISYMNGDYFDILTMPHHDLVGLSDTERIQYKSYTEALNAGILEALKYENRGH